MSNSSTTTSTNHYPFQLQPLPYPYDSLEPHIDTQTMQLHHDKHLRTYITNLNNALQNYPKFHTWSLEKLLYNAHLIPEPIRKTVKNNAGGVYNHNLYFNLLTPNSTKLKPSSPLFEAINKTYGSLDHLKSELKTAALEVFGSGWAILTVDKNTCLKIIKLPNQDTQIPNNLTPIITVDVWEHAYYLKNQNRRPEYFDHWWEILNWNQAENHFEQHKHTDYSKL